MSKTMSLRLPDSIHRQLKALAERDGVSMNHMVTLAVAEKTAALLTLDYLEARAARGDRQTFEAALAAVPDREPDSRDRLPVK
jgi:predicted transcriptional regulator